MADTIYKPTPGDDPNLKNLYHAMQYSPDGYPEIRTASRIEIDAISNINVEVSVGPSVEVSNFPDIQQIIGNVNAAITSTVEVEVKNDEGNPLPVVMAWGNSSVSFNPMQTDAFGRFRISNPFTLFDSFHRYQDNSKITQKLVGTASTSHNSNASVISCTIGTDANDAVYRESARVFAYQPGKSLSILTTFCMADPTGKPGLRQRIGYFDTQNGIYFQQLGNTASFIIRSNSNNSIVEDIAPQSTWNVDKLDGNGPSGYTLDLTKVQILFIDLEWLGVGTVRVGFVIDGQFIPVHHFHHANQPSTLSADNTTTYMGTACLPVRMEFENTNASVSSSTYKQICTSVISEGGYELQGRPLTAGHPLASPYNIGSTNTVYPILAVRLKSNRLGAIVLPTNFSIAVSGNANYQFWLRSNATVSGGTWVSAGDNSSVEYNLTATSVINGSNVDVGYIINSNQSSPAPSQEPAPFKYQLERNTFTGNTYTFAVCLESSAGNKDVWAALNWQEVT